jgi:hypothetical protein
MKKLFAARRTCRARASAERPALPRTKVAIREEETSYHLSPVLGTAP